MIITVVSRADFSGYAPSRSAAVLRIYDPHEDWSGDAARLSVAGWGACLPLSFWDVGFQGMKPGEALLARLLGRWRGICVRLGQRLYGCDDIPWRPFLAADARAIARFGDSLADRGIRHLMVVCGNGRARSWTIAQFLARRLHADLTASRGWQRESSAIARLLARVPPRKATGSSPAFGRLEAAE